MANLLSQKRMVNKLLEAHNTYRAKHGSPPLELDPKLNELAAEHAQYLATHHILRHANKKSPDNEDELLGESLLRVNLTVGGCENTGGAEIAEAWYKEKKMYDFESHQFSSYAPAFSQMVWKSSQRVGFGFSLNDDEHLYVVAFYYPAGNVGNQFKENVFPSLEAESDEEESESEEEKEEEKEKEKRKEEAPRQPETAQERFIREALKAHNEYRKRHSTEPLVHNPELSQVAQKYAQYLASRNTMKHSDCNWNGKRLGENLAMVMDSRLSCYPGDKATKQWYDEIAQHNFNGDHQSATGHFTQVVSKSSTDVGFGVAQSSNGSFYAVANYYPAGNMIGTFRQNVSPPSGGGSGSSGGGGGCGNSNVVYYTTTTSGCCRR